MSKSTDAVRKYETARERNMARARLIKKLQQSWVAGSELTPAQLAEIQPTLKQATIQRHPDWFGEAAA